MSRSFGRSVGDETRKGLGLWSQRAWMPGMVIIPTLTGPRAHSCDLFAEQWHEVRTSSPTCSHNTEVLRDSASGLEHSHQPLPAPDRSLDWIVICGPFLTSVLASAHNSGRQGKLCFTWLDTHLSSLEGRAVDALPKELGLPLSFPTSSVSFLLGQQWGSLCLIQQI